MQIVHVSSDDGDAGKGMMPVMRKTGGDGRVLGRCWFEDMIVEYCGQLRLDLVMLLRLI